MEINKVVKSKFEEKHIGYIVNGNVFVPLEAVDNVAGLALWLANNEVDYLDYTWIEDGKRIDVIDRKAYELITSSYPIYRQVNISLLLEPYTKSDLDAMRLFISSIRSIAKNAKDTGMAVDEIDWQNLDSFKPN